MLRDKDNNLAAPSESWRFQMHGISRGSHQVRPSGGSILKTVPSFPQASPISSHRAQANRSTRGPHVKLMTGVGRIDRVTDDSPSDISGPERGPEVAVHAARLRSATLHRHIGYPFQKTTRKRNIDEKTSGERDRYRDGHPSLLGMTGSQS